MNNKNINLISLKNNDEYLKLLLNNKKIENKVVKHGLLFGGGILLFHSTVCNWHVIHDYTKLFVLFSVMLFLIMYSYKKTIKLK